MFPGRMTHETPVPSAFENPLGQPYEHCKLSTGNFLTRRWNLVVFGHINCERLKRFHLVQRKRTAGEGFLTLRSEWNLSQRFIHRFSRIVLILDFY